ncbi:MAG: GTP 3',8-cyclase MoaA [Verrucomicrobiota bacterium]
MKPAQAAVASPPALDQLGRPLRDLRVSLIDRCNLRCPYCMPREIFGADYPFLPSSAWLSFLDIERIIRAFVPLGLRKLRLTGGEPLLRPKLPELVASLAAIPELDDLALTTNGVRLEALAAPLAEAGLHRVTVSLDGMSPTSVRHLSGERLRSPEPVLRGIDRARSLGLGVKVNTVVRRGVNHHEIVPLARHFIERGLPLRFIEYMDVGNSNDWKREQVVPTKDLHAQVSEHWTLEPLEAAYRGEVARRYRVLDAAPGAEIGFVSSISEPFCRDCNRARLSAEGQLFTCLFASRGTDLRPWLPCADAELSQRLRALWSGRKDRYSEERAEGKAVQKVEMGYIGG